MRTMYRSTAPLIGLLAIVVSAGVQFLTERRIKPASVVATGLGIGIIVFSAEAWKGGLRKRVASIGAPKGVAPVITTELAPGLHKLTRRVPVVQTQVYEDTAITIDSLDCFDDGFLLSGRILLAEKLLHSTAGVHHDRPFNDYPSPALAVVDDGKHRYKVWPRSNEGIGRDWRFKFCCAPVIPSSAYELRLMIPELRWERINHRQGNRTTVDTLPGEWNFTISLTAYPESERA